MTPRKHPGSWAHHRRTYILHPYRAVTDSKTGLECRSPDDVLDGDIDAFLEAGIRLRATQRKPLTV